MHFVKLLCFLMAYVLLVYFLSYQNFNVGKVGMEPELNLNYLGHNHLGKGSTPLLVSLLQIHSADFWVFWSFLEMKMTFDSFC